jgi:hypothetical protein
MCIGDEGAEIIGTCPPVRSYPSPCQLGPEQKNLNMTEKNLTASSRRIRYSPTIFRDFVTCIRLAEQQPGEAGLDS